MFYFSNSDWSLIVATLDFTLRLHIRKASSNSQQSNRLEGKIKVRKTCFIQASDWNVRNLSFNTLRVADFVEPLRLGLNALNLMADFLEGVSVDRVVESQMYIKTLLFQCSDCYGSSEIACEDLLHFHWLQLIELGYKNTYFYFYFNNTTTKYCM